MPASLTRARRQRAGTAEKNDSRLRRKICVAVDAVPEEIEAMRLVTEPATTDVVRHAVRDTAARREASRSRGSRKRTVDGTHPSIDLPCFQCGRRHLLRRPYPGHGAVDLKKFAHYLVRNYPGLDPEDLAFLLALRTGHLHGQLAELGIHIGLSAIGIDPSEFMSSGTKYESWQHRKGVDCFACGKLVESDGQRVGAPTGTNLNWAAWLARLTPINYKPRPRKHGVVDY